MHEITITEIVYSHETADTKATERIERFKQVVDELDIVAVINAVNGRKRGPKRKAA